MYIIDGYVSVCASIVAQTLERDGIVPRLEFFLFFAIYFYFYLYTYILKIHKRCTIQVRLGVFFCIGFAMHFHVLGYRSHEININYDSICIFVISFGRARERERRKDGEKNANRKK